MAITQTNQPKLTAFMTSIFGVNWRTCLTGWLTGSIPAIYALIDAYQTGAFTGKTGLALVFAVLIVVKSYLTKDARVTGLPSENNKTIPNDVGKNSK